MSATRAEDTPPRSARGVVKPRKLEARGHQLARAHQTDVSTDAPLRPPGERLQRAGRRLERAYRELAAAAADEQGDFPPGAAWILDNFYLVRDQLRDVLLGLRRAHYRKLPRLTEGPFAGTPRVYEILDELVRALDHAIVEADLTTIVRAYQETNPLLLGELWAVPGALRGVLLERLATLATEETEAHRERVQAGEWADRIASAAEDDPARGVIVAGDMFEDRRHLSDAFVLELAERLRPQGAAARPVLNWIERRLERRRLSFQDILRQETQRQVSLANAFKSLRWASTERWGPWVERVSRIERELRLDPSHTYAGMDFETRDQYRRAVEALARGSEASEWEVVERAVSIARTADGDELARHVGYHLIGPGRPEFERTLGFVPRKRDRLRAALRRHPAAAFGGVLSGAWVVLMTALLLIAAAAGASPPRLVAAAALAALPLLELSVALANRVFAYTLRPDLLPKLSRDGGVGRERRTLVVVPTLITSAASAREQVERLEILSFANPDPNVRFALLSDFADAPQARMPTDDETLSAAVEAIRALNARHADDWGDRFFLLHRERRWSDSELCWMGWERKRGKLEELNTLLRRPDEPTTYTTVEGDFFLVTADDEIRYVITLDADTRMPPQTVVDLVRTAAHPLNRPRYDPESGTVTAGYGIIQPRLGVEATRAPRTPFARIMSGNVGVDPYTKAVSDVYQDLFGTGIYTGKGLYDVDAFEATLSGVIPPERVLSHDLLESMFVRAGLATDILLFDDFPGHYIPWARRLHRWVRGDWQILPWLGGSIRLRDRTRAPNPIRALGRWQILDNVRRSLSPLSLLLFFVGGWLLFPGAAGWWTLLGLAVLAFPVYVGLTTTVFERPAHVTWRSWLERAGEELEQNLLQTSLLATLLAHLAIYQLDAAVRATTRMLFTRRRLLEWKTAAQVERQTRADLRAYVRFMLPGMLIGAGTGLLVAALAPGAFPYALPFAVLWTASPWIAHALAHRRPRKVARLSEEERRWLRRIGRRTWAYFEDLWSAEHSWLPPDNLQLDPLRGTASRTSPTNIGLGLVAAQCALDFGWVSRTAHLNRVEATLDTIRRMEKYRGHLYNWYETTTAERLWPPYVSTADSGNLAASLIVVAGGLDEIAGTRGGAPGAGENAGGGRDDAHPLLRGLADTAGVVADLAAGPDPLPDPDLEAAAKGLLAELERRFAEDPMGDDGPDLRDGAIERLESLARRLEVAGRVVEEDAIPEPVRIARDVRARLAAVPAARIREWVEERAADPEEVAGRARGLAARCRGLVDRMDFRFLYAPRRGLLTIGYNVETRAQDEAVYDLLASEARMASLIAAAADDVPTEHWFRLGRPVIDVGRRATLLSWSGTMFEYLMPLLFTPAFHPTLLADSCRGAVEWQRRYGARLGKPWGASESQYAAVNAEQDYRYRAFGVPGLGLRRGLADDYVVAPYAALLALMVEAPAACRNLERLEVLGAVGVYGFYEAVDFTPPRLPPGREHYVVRTFMAHHAGMSLGALANTLGNGRIQSLFRRSPRMQSVELLLQERVPYRVVSSVPHPLETATAPAEAPPVAEVVDHLRWDHAASTPPRGIFLSNGRLRSYVHRDGSGLVCLDDDALNRAHLTDPRFPLGFFLYLRDLDSGRYWSVTHEPVRSAPDRLELWFHFNKLELARVEDWIETFLEVVVSPEDDVDVRRLTVTNYSDRPRRLEVTSYAEVVLDEPRADHVHPAFSKLFVRTERSPGHEALLATRRHRDATADPIWLVHTLACDRARMPDPARFETDRMRFIGRGRDLSRPRAMEPGVEHSGSEGHVLDPIVSLQKPFILGPGEKVQLGFCLGGARDREAATRLADLYDNQMAVERAIGLATASATLERQRLAVDGERLQEFQRLGSLIHTAAPGLRQPEHRPPPGSGSQPNLWRHGISGDLPIVTARIGSTDELETARWLVEGFGYWRRKGLALDLILLNEHGPSYADELQHALERLAEQAATTGDAGGSVYVLRADLLSDTDRRLLLSVARAVVDGAVPDLDGLFRTVDPSLAPDDPQPSVRAGIREAPGRDGVREAPPGVDTPDAPRGESGAAEHLTDKLLMFNGFGGFDVEAREYRIAREPERPPVPAPWSNVIANSTFGFLVSESGSGPTWSVNSRQRRLSPWFNDPVTDPAGEALYLRDDETGSYWSPLPATGADSDTGGPDAAAGATVEVRHGMGYSRFASARDGLDQDVTLYVDPHESVKFVRIRIRNRSDRNRRISAFYYLEWVLGVLRAESAPHVVTEFHLEEALILGRNPYDRDFGDRVAFLGADPDVELASGTCDRESFLGADFDVSRPAAVREPERLDGRDGQGLDPCAALRVRMELEPDSERTLYFYVGDADGEAGARDLARRARQPGAAGDAWEAVGALWDSIGDALLIRTPAPELDVLVNQWLPYQTLACRLWGRTAFYQSGGAFGFRDQLQDVTGLVYSRPDLTRAQILLHAAHQFVEGDVLHWWHPPAGRGVRTRITDDLLWLPYVVSFYVESTGDGSVLDEQVPFIDARKLDEDEHEAYVDPERSEETGDIYDHCCRAIDHALRFGPNGLPLIGTGDWNDGMNRVGEEGRGESVWLGFFLVTVIDGFIPFVRERGDLERVRAYTSARERMIDALQTAGWDGAWYRRAYFDDGTPLGSAENGECRIDAIAQGWAISSGVASSERARAALDSVERLLVDEEGGLLRLLTPPFEKSEPDPGYIQGYPPGVRENGGQYTHGALWAVRAFADLGQGDRAVALLRMMAPPNHTSDADGVMTFLNEPYVVTADVYSVPPHVGRGGWSWYTGSGGWFFRIAVESLLGFRLCGGTAVELRPCIASDWPGYRIEYRLPDSETRYVFDVENPDGVQTGIAEVEVDGSVRSVGAERVRVELNDDGRTHAVRVRMGSTTGALRAVRGPLRDPLP